MTPPNTPTQRDALARAYLDGPRVPVAPRDAATVALLRDGPSGIETLLLHRPDQMAFAAGMHVYPGGSVDPTDTDTDTGYPWSGAPPRHWAHILDSDEPVARSLLAAAVRETFEETGVLLAGGDTPPPPTRLRTWRAALRRGDMSFPSILSEHGLALRSDALTAWARWVTPEFSPRRFDTRFFLAPLPAGQAAEADGDESDAARWVPVKGALASYRAGELPMMMVTAALLRDLAPYESIGEIPAGGRDLTPLTLRAVDCVGGFRYVIDVDGVPVEEADFMADEASDDLLPHIHERSAQ